MLAMIIHACSWYTTLMQRVDPIRRAGLYLVATTTAPLARTLAGSEHERYTQDLPKERFIPMTCSIM